MSSGNKGSETTDSGNEEQEMICALTADEAFVLRQRLAKLPLTMPPRDVWQRIREQAAAEGLLAAPKTQNRNKWYAGAGLAAAILVVAVMLPSGIDVMNPDAVVPMGETSNPNDLSRLRTLQVQSRQLERDLRSLPAEPRVERAGTVATLSEIESRIAAIDYQLNDPTVEWADGDKEIFWGERVRLMKLLLQLRYAQAQRAAY